MFYSIGDVSKILNVSKEMIRYYEKQGALKPARKENNNYRSYSTMDIFFLMEMIRYQALGLTTTEINQLLNNNYMQSYSDCLSNYHKKLEKEITFKMVLKDRIKEMADIELKRVN
ncbi:MerR family transcriptional regulator [uncultured Catenibacterium sp.]|uniref:MerR family transcriptional regulator n=1 Tax=uncultured Catenibacterium sp. TaxID=286142 RepID=UPI0025DE1393|nr:MerR family transcriptional regulator [uncultured Catenibacterium sp.]